MKKFKNIALIILIVTLVLIVVGCGLYNYKMGAVSKSDEIVEINIPSKTSTKGIGEILEKNKVIRDSNFFAIYVKLFGYNDLKSGLYDLKPNMGVKKIVEVLREGSKKYPDEITLTFNEGLTIRGIAKIIAKSTNNTYDQVLEKANDLTFINTLIDRYWFLTKDVLNEQIYYKIEGYLFPDTYRFKNKDVSIEDIFNKMLEGTDRVLSKYKGAIEASGKSYQEILTLASITESETSNEIDRPKVAQVFLNRLKVNMNLGSDVTTYYAFRRELNSGELTKVQYNTSNPYNTRGPGMEGKLPVGPICNPSESAISAAITPADHDYLYFIADMTTGETFYTRTYAEHLQVKETLSKK